MNDEIKEILEFLKPIENRICATLGSKKCELLLDYITNLQEDIRIGQEINSELQQENDNEVEENLKLSKWLVEKQQRIEGLEAENETLRSDFKNQIEYTNKIAEENERLKEIWKDTNVIVKDNKLLVMNTNAYDILEDYKSRCEKAGEYIDKQKKKMYKSRNKIAMFILMKLENILQNGSDEE